MHEYLLESPRLKWACCKEWAVKRQCSGCSNMTSGFLELNHMLLALTYNLLPCQLLAECLDLVLPISDKHPSFLALFSFGNPYKLWYDNRIFFSLSAYERWKQVFSWANSAPLGSKDFSISIFLPFWQEISTCENFDTYHTLYSSGYYPFKMYKSLLKGCFY